MGIKAELIGLVRTYWALLLGNGLEWYEFAVYGYLAVYLEKQFFQGSAIGVWLGFGVTFMSRPLGGLVMGLIGDRFGRSAAMNISIIGMIVGTFGQGCLPSYVSSGRALGHFGLTCLILLRCIQGLSAAGEIAAISTYLTEVAAPSSVCRVTALIAFTANLGFLAAKATVFSVEAVFGAAAMEQWAWRLPFLFALPPGLLAVWGRRRVPESGMFLEDSKGQQETSVQKIRKAFRSHWLNMLISAGGVASFAVLQYGCFVWGQSFLRHSGMSEDDRMAVGLINRLVQIVFALPVGWVGDTIGIGWVMFGGSVAVVCCALPLWLLVAAAPTNFTTVALAMGVGLGLLGSIQGSLFFYFVVELFPTSVRTTAGGLSYNIGFAVFGGAAPILAQWAVERSYLGPGLLYMAGGCVTMLSMLAGVLLQRRGLVTLAHVRPTPYFRGRTSRGDAFPEATKTNVNVVGGQVEATKLGTEASPAAGAPAGTPTSAAEVLVYV